jgi:Fur family transcriptional regulator, ferric uptake regulator
MEHRHTIQKDLVLHAVTDLKRHVTADEIYDYIKKDYPTIGKGTVYRNLGILAEEGAIRKVEVPDGPSYFDFTLKSHYHVRCVKCGAVSDVDLEIIPDLIGKIRDTHGMEFLGYDIFFRGVCPVCREK